MKAHQIILLSALLMGAATFSIAAFVAAIAQAGYGAG
jgi:hypothetical protein